MAVAVLVRVSLVLVVLSFQLHILTMAITQYRIVPKDQDESADHRDGAVKALLILAYVLLIVSISILLFIKYFVLKARKGDVIMTSLVIFLAGISCTSGHSSNI